MPLPSGTRRRGALDRWRHGLRTSKVGDHRPQPRRAATHDFPRFKITILTYNGEIYNFRELRSELEGRGYVFASQTDSEVVLYSLVEWGPDAILKFNGMFALAFWDNKKKRVLLARDRYGIKPLYYFQNSQKLVLPPSKKPCWNNLPLIG